MTNSSSRVLIVLALTACTSQPSKVEENTQAAGEADAVERLDPALDMIISPGARLEVLGEGYNWAEGPLWVPSHNMLLFTDVPENVVYVWREGEQVKEYLRPSGYTGEASTTSREPGANGLALDSDGRLILCQHGNRQLARMMAPLDNPAPEFEPLATQHDGKRFNSPNDLAIMSNGDIYFTDPPYGLAGLDESPLKEIPYNGVYRLKTSGEVGLLTKELSKPNGIAFSPDEKTLYVANSDGEWPIWMSFPLNDDGTLGEGRVFFDASGLEGQGSQDGLKVDSRGNVFATGPGGVLVFSAAGKHLGTIKTGAATANFGFGENEKIAFITADDKLLRMKLRD